MRLGLARRVGLICTLGTALVANSAVAIASIISAPPELNKENISKTRTLILHDGINNVQFWGQELGLLAGKVLPGEPNLLFQRQMTIIQADAGLPNAGDSTVYFIMSGGKSPPVGVRFPGSETYLLDAHPANGQSSASAVRFFDGVWNGRCQTFAVVASNITDQQTQLVFTKINLYYFIPGMIYANGSEGNGPLFSLLQSYQVKNGNPDPEIEISREFSLVLPDQYHKLATELYSQSATYSGDGANDKRVVSGGVNDPYAAPSKSGC